MYSKDMGITRVPASVGLQHPGRSPRVSVPPNYRGHAIVDGEERPLGFLGTAGEDTPSLPTADTPVPRFEGLPRVSQLGESRRSSSLTYSMEPTYHTDNGGVADADLKGDGSAEPFRDIPHHPPSADHSNGKNPSDSIQNSGFPSTAPHRPAISTTNNLLSPSRGILSLGLEELLLLGLILFLLRESGECTDRGDLDETVILLGLLLLLG